MTIMQSNLLHFYSKFLHPAKILLFYFNPDRIRIRCQLQSIMDHHSGY